MFTLLYAEDAVEITGRELNDLVEKSSFLQADLKRYEAEGLKIVYQPRESDNAPPNYCEDCDGELFCTLFVKAKPDKDENGYDYWTIIFRAWSPYQALDRAKKGNLDFAQNLIKIPSGDFKQVSEEFQGCS